MAKKIIREFLGTTLFVFGVATLVITRNVLSISLGIGMIFISLIYGISKGTNGFFNPAVTLGMWINKRINWKEFLGYIIVQILGGLLGAYLSYLVFSNIQEIISLTTTGENVESGKYIFLNSVGHYVPIIYANSRFVISTAVTVALETVFAFILTYNVLKVTENKKNKFAPLIIALTMVGISLIGWHMTGGEANPARSVGTSVIAKIFFAEADITHLYSYVLGPLLGSLIAGFMFKFCEKKKNETEEISE